MKRLAWSRNYPALKDQVIELRDEFTEICHALGVSPPKVLSEFEPVLIARIARESNWQEGIYLENSRVRGLTQEVFRQDLEIEGYRPSDQAVQSNVDLFVDQLRDWTSGILADAPRGTNGTEAARSLTLIEACYESAQPMHLPWVTR